MVWDVPLFLSVAIYFSLFDHMCLRVHYFSYGTIISTKAILDKDTQKCKGYGFVDFNTAAEAESAVKALLSQGIQAQMAKVSRGKQIEDPKYKSLFLIGFLSSGTFVGEEQRVNFDQAFVAAYCLDLTDVHFISK